MINIDFQATMKINQTSMLSPCCTCATMFKNVLYFLNKTLSKLFSFFYNGMMTYNHNCLKVQIKSTINRIYAKSQPSYFLVMIKGERKKASKQRANTTEQCKCKIYKPVNQTVMVKELNQTQRFKRLLFHSLTPAIKRLSFWHCQWGWLHLFFCEYWMCR